jgi:hypothetical protein
MYRTASIIIIEDTYEIIPGAQSRRGSISLPDIGSLDLEILNVARVIEIMKNNVESAMCRPTHNLRKYCQTNIETLLFGTVTTSCQTQKPAV